MQSNSSDNCNISIRLRFWIFLTRVTTDYQPVIKNKLKELLSELDTFKLQAILVLDYKKKLCS